MTKNLIDFAIFTLIQFFFITNILMYLYQGGSYFHPEIDYYVYNQNYLSDLGRIYYFNQAKNPFWFFYTFSLALVGVGTIIYFFIISKLLARFHYFPVISGLISGIAYIGLAFLPVDVSYPIHILFGYIAYIFFLLAGVTVMILIDKKAFPDIYYLILILNELLIVYLIIGIFSHLIERTEFYLKLKVVLQKVVVYAQLFISVYILCRIKWRYYKVYFTE